MEGTRVDGHAFAVSCTVNSNSVSFTETADMTNQAGDHPAELVISNGSDRLGTMNFVISVEPCAMDENAEITEEDQSLFNQLYEKLATGSPATAATVAEMTNTDAVYLYTGSETGYTAGDWYYYDGSSWVSGGTYGSGFDPDGTYPGLTAGQLYTENGVENVEPYFFRAVPTAASEARLKKVVGGTVAWNQLVNNVTHFTNSTTDTKGNLELILRYNTGVSGSFSGIGSNILTGLFWLYFTASASGSGWHLYHNGSARNITIWSTSSSAPIENHKYLITFNVVSNDVSTVGGLVIDNLMLFDITQIFGSTIADYVNTLSATTNKIAKLKEWGFFAEPYYTYNPGLLKSVEGLTSHETIGFNAFNKDDIVSGKVVNSQTGAEINNASYSHSGYIRVVPNNVYVVLNVVYSSAMHSGAIYDANKQYIGALSFSANVRTFTVPQNGAYVIINFLTVNKDSVCLHLRRDESLDEYEPYEKHSYPLDDSLTLRGIPKLDSNNNLYYDGDEYLADGTVTRKYGTRAYQSGDVTGDTMITDGTNTVYKLATPTTETADPFTESQVIDPYGTEEFVSTGIVPVGHDTLYVDDLRQRLEDIAPPTTDGTYTLQVTVSGGRPTFSWVAANRSLSMGNPLASSVEEEPVEEAEEQTEEEPVEEGDVR